MSNTYTFKTWGEHSAAKASVISLIVIALYIAVIFLVFAGDTLYIERSYFYFAGGALWFLAFIISLNRSAYLTECEIGTDGLKINAKRSTRSTSSKKEEFDWSQLESYSIMKGYSGTLLWVKLKNATMRKWLTIPFYNNEPENIRQFMRDFEKYAGQHNAGLITSRKNLRPSVSFHQTRLARIIGYVIIAYLVTIFALKLTALDDGKIPWSNVFSTTFFAAIYLTFVFWKRR